MQIIRVLILIACLGWIFLEDLPQFVKDATSTGWRPAPELTVEKAECRVTNFLFSLCDASWKGRGDKGRVAFSLLGPVDEAPVSLTRASNGHVSVKYALDHMVRRMLTIFTSLLGAAWWFYAFVLRGGSGAALLVKKRD